MRRVVLAMFFLLDQELSDPYFYLLYILNLLKSPMETSRKTPNMVTKQAKSDQTFKP